MKNKTVVVCVVVAVSWLGMSNVAAQVQGVPADIVGPGVAAAVQDEGAADVMIMLADPVVMTAPLTDVATLSAQVASLQQIVLAGIAPADFQERHRFRTIPALAGRITTSALAALRTHPNVVRIDLDVGGSGSLAVTVPLIGADLFASAGVTGAGVQVAVLDSGNDSNHPDLSDDLIHEECFVDLDGTINGVGACPNGSDRQSGSGAAESAIGHGVMTTGVITSRGTVSSPGVAPDADIVSIKVLDDTPPAGLFQFFSEIVAALDFIIASRPDVDVINMSFGTFAQYGGDCDNTTAFNLAGAAAINTLWANGVIAFASSGNDSSPLMMKSPACLSKVVSVGATNNSDQVASFSNAGVSLDVLAPGVGVTTTNVGGGTTTASGTSFSSPHAAGCAALMIESGVATTPQQIKDRVTFSSITVLDSRNGMAFPRINCSPFSGLYSLDSFGAVYAGRNAAPMIPATPYFGFDVAVDFELTRAGVIVLDGYGGLHAGGGAALSPPATPYFGFDIARDLELASAGFYVLDGFGVVHAGGGAAPMAPSTPFFGFDVAVDMELASPGVYVLDGFGGLHAGGGAPLMTPATPYFGFNVARDMELAIAGGVHVLDGFGVVHAGGGAVPLTPATPFLGFDIARDLELAATGFFVLDGWGGLHVGGGATKTGSPLPYPGFDVIRALELR